MRGVCGACRRGKTNCCRNLAVMGVHCDGGLTEYVAVPERFVIQAFNGLPSLDALAMTEFLAIGRHAVRRAQMSPGQRALVVGAGPIGIGAALFARLDGAEVTVIDPCAERLAFCKNVLGLKHASPEDDLTQTLQETTDGEFST